MKDRWHQVTEIFHAAGKLSDGTEREAYLVDACGGDPSLRADVEALLAGHGEAGSFGERPLAAERSAAEHLSSGTRLGPHEILRLVGAGGMGEVYEARDTRLDRFVAVKVLPSECGSDPERRARFVREAKTIAKLNHPHILKSQSDGTSPGAHQNRPEPVRGASGEGARTVGG